ncbi:MAG TPA: trypsin-like peptidase domain-containing protein [Anaerolineaceae bacterium]|nr:trypsin-like peptidase domain-containing protein [Anaerolineaceae bacterium]
MKRTSRVFAVFLAIVVLAQAFLASSCTAAEPYTTPTSPDYTATITLEPTQTSTPAPTATPAYVYNVKDVRKATVRIEASGLPELNTDKSEGVGYGSGAIIDPTGLVLTNNHVVAGANKLKISVWHEDGTTGTYTGKVVGVSECADLALVKIQNEGPFPYLSWREEPLEIGAQIFAAGFPGGGEYTLTDGIISKDAGKGDTSWASVQSVIEHTAKINPGSSGGPLVDENGFLVGINFGSNAVTDQNLTITKATVDEIYPLLEKNEADDMGISGLALADLQEEGWNYGGVLVTSVRDGSKAADAGLLPGDILFLLGNSVPSGKVSMEELEQLAEDDGLAQDGTMKEYCSALRGEISDGDKVDVLVVRPVYNSETDKVVGTQTCRGSINGSAVECSGTPYTHITFDDASEMDQWQGFVIPGSNRNSVKVDITDGQMVFKVTGESTKAYWIYDGVDTEDVQIDVTAENTGAFENAISIVCRFTQDNDDYSWYEFNISSERLFYLMRYSNGGWILLDSGMSTELNYGHGTNTYRAICKDDWLILYINGVEKVRIQDSWLKSGKVGLSALALWNPYVVVGFDNLVIGPPEEE